MGEGASFFWVEEYKEEQNVPVFAKRKYKTKKLEYDGWGSRQLIEFLESIGVDTSKQIPQYDVANIVLKYVNDNNLLHPAKKKRISCDEGLLSVFGKKTISRIKVYDLLEMHYKENKVDSDPDFLFSSEEEDNAGKSKVSNSVRKVQSKPKVKEAPRSAFAAIVPENIKWVYLKKNLVHDLLKDMETFESKIVGSFVKIKSDPDDYLQKNPYMLVQVAGVKKAAGADDSSAEFLLTVSNYIKDVQISMLSDRNFSEEECEDLRQRMQGGYLHKPTIGELEEKVKVLHEDVTKHWIVEELAMLERQIEHSNLKGWRRELSEFLDRKQLLQTPAEQSRLLSEIPKIIAEVVETDATAQDGPHNTNNENNDPSDLESPGDNNMENEKNDPPDLTAAERLEHPGDNKALIKSPSTCIPSRPDSAATYGPMFMSNQSNVTDNCNDDQDEEHEGEERKDSLNGRGPEVLFLEESSNSEGSEDEQEQPSDDHQQNNDDTQPVKSEDNNRSNCMVNSQVIELSDDDEDDHKNDKFEVLDYDLGSFVWYYRDPQGETQGPFSLASLKRWNDALYFPPDFKVWKRGRSFKDAVLLRDILKCF